MKHHPPRWKASSPCFAYHIGPGRNRLALDFRPGRYGVLVFSFREYMSTLPVTAEEMFLLQTASPP